jgi:hypothetical protein
MVSMILAFLLALSPMGQDVAPLVFEVRAPANLLFGNGEKSGKPFYDVVVTRLPTSGVLVKLDYNRRDTKFSFDLHHRLSLDPSFTLPAEVTTIVEVISGGSTSMGVFTISSTIKPGEVFEESITKVSKAEVDRYVTPVGRKTITLNTIPGSQSLSIVGQAVIITRGAKTERRESPSARIAMVSNFKFEENVAGTILKVD